MVTAAAETAAVMAAELAGGLAARVETAVRAAVACTEPSRLQTAGSFPCTMGSMSQP